MDRHLAAGIVITFGRSGRAKPSQAPIDFPLHSTKCIFAACLHISLQIVSLTCILAGKHSVHSTQCQPELRSHPPTTLATPSLRWLWAANNILTFNSAFVFGRWRCRCRCCNSKRSRHRMLHANFCFAKSRKKVATTFQIIYFGIARLRRVFMGFVCELLSCQKCEFKWKQHCATCSRNSCLMLKAWHIEWSRVELSWFSAPFKVKCFGNLSANFVSQHVIAGNFCFLLLFGGRGCSFMRVCVRVMCFACL